MRNLTLLVAVILMTGCVSALKFTTHASHALEPDNNFFETKIYDSYDDAQDLNGIFVKLEAMNVETGELYFRTFDTNNTSGDASTVFWNYYRAETKRNCQQILGGECVVTREHFFQTPYEKIFYTSLDDYKQKEIKRMAALRLQEKAELERQERISIALREKAEKDKLDEEEKRVAVLLALKERCIEYGFTGNNNIASCIQREAQHDFEIEQQKYQVALLKQELSDQRLYASQNTQQVQANELEEIPFWMEILGAFAEGAAEGYKQKQLIEALDSRYQGKTRYIYKAEVECGIYGC
jgi:hypothetical protein